ncbi:hypothetical protein D3C76_1453480 [compost metagenome]
MTCLERCLPNAKAAKIRYKTQPQFILEYDGYTRDRAAARIRVREHTGLGQCHYTGSELDFICSSRRDDDCSRL